MPGDARLRRGRAAWVALTASVDDDADELLPAASSPSPAVPMRSTRHLLSAEEGMEEEEVKQEAEADAVALPTQPRARKSAARSRPSLRSAASASSAAAASTPAVWLSIHRQLATQAHKLEREVSLPHRAAAWLLPPTLSAASSSVVSPSDADADAEMTGWLRAEELRAEERHRERQQLEKGVARVGAVVSPFVAHMLQHRRRAETQRMKTAKDGEAAEVQDAEEAEEVLQLQVELERVEAALSRFKQEQRHSYLAMDVVDQQLSAELDTHTARITAWEAETPDTAPHSAIASTRSKQPHAHHSSSSPSSLSSAPALPPALVAVNRDIAQAGGSTGGWSSEDHEQFLSLFHSSASQAVLLSRLYVAFPHVAAEDCRSHLAWWSRYQRWSEEKRFIIKEWRNSKLREREKDWKREEERQQARAEAEEEDGQAAADDQQEEKAREEQQRKQQRAAAIAQWRKEKAEREREQGRQEEQRQRRSRQQEQRQRAAYHQQQKLALQAAMDSERQRKAEEEAQAAVEALDRQREEETRRRESERRLQLQHVLELQQRAEARRQREDKERDAAARHDRLLAVSSAIVGAKAERSRDRVQGRTEASEWRAAAVEDSVEDRRDRQRRGKQAQMSMQPLVSQTLLIPQWRQGLS